MFEMVCDCSVFIQVAMGLMWMSFCRFQIQCVMGTSFFPHQSCYGVDMNIVVSSDMVCDGGIVLSSLKLLWV